jgi:hypothetical protein
MESVYGQNYRAAPLPPMWRFASMISTYQAYSKRDGSVVLEPLSEKETHHTVLTTHDQFVDPVETPSHSDDEQ